MVDTRPEDIRPDSVWRSLGRSVAAGTGALVALVSLLSGAALTTACLRGGVALFGILFLTRIGAAAIASVQRAEGGRLAEAALEGAEPQEIAD